ncbi:MAG: hypothetical protein A3J73_05695 [Planctomycetes bacterium RIFCSPHIGHO2_02_FULL_38_41]|nr:MAG: hypothetical protein A3J73_05695 [Planctomycetes bacterium RIFCSPHIGHO2_02_FULL_38_41]OHB97392.1 MAG: hypothetical protein A2W74_06205 [Planctomycetes bacterium RIFCSPLOWO2_12_38_17]
MKFYNLEDKEICKDEWISYYSEIYFSGYNRKYKNHKVKVNGSSRFVEGLIEDILNGKEGLSRENIILINAWKTGNINHKLSEAQNEIIFYTLYQKELKDNRFHKTKDYTEAINHIVENIQRYTNNALAVEELFNELKGLPSLGPVYAINFIYFFTHGEYSIYDQFANRALKGIIEEQIPNFQYSNENKIDWQTYQNEYIAKIEKVFGKRNIERRDDQALFVYGHLFKQKIPKKNCC